jgi:hypothetical protein
MRLKEDMPSFMLMAYALNAVLFGRMMRFSRFLPTGEDIFKWRPGSKEACPVLP